MERRKVILSKHTSSAPDSKYRSARATGLPRLTLRAGEGPRSWVPLTEAVIFIAILSALGFAQRSMHYIIRLVNPSTSEIVIVRFGKERYSVSMAWMGASSHDRRTLKPALANVSG
ncbi:hypothetical protein BS47DRAFT_774586 [Hydnum rufescens UP504]|uniref:Uncharacterized protein n=1 Tax=Hydnum rufescens UP504 TaxID=1448309 RepID=A0A9P6B185_9AGAM|nr:hypothetical protein BS47DRAFT_774586 [Hydnum rufescens UP504]